MYCPRVAHTHRLYAAHTHRPRTAQLRCPNGHAMVQTQDGWLICYVCGYARPPYV